MPRYRNPNWPDMKEHTQPKGLEPWLSSTPPLPILSSTFPKVPMKQLVSSQIRPPQQGGILVSAWLDALIL